MNLHSKALDNIEGYIRVNADYNALLALDKIILQEDEGEAMKANKVQTFIETLLNQKTGRQK